MRRMEGEQFSFVAATHGQQHGMLWHDFLPCLPAGSLPAI